MASLKEQVDRIKETLKKDDENVEIKLYESGDTLLIPETSDDKGEGGGSGDSYTVKGGGDGGNTAGSGSGTNYGSGGSGGGGDDDGGGREEPKIDGGGSGSGTDGDGGDTDGDGGGSGGDGGNGGGDQKKIKVGTKVRVKSNGRVGTVTRVNDDGTYEVQEDEDAYEMEDGGVFEVFAEGGITSDGTYTEDELEVISSGDGGSGGETDGGGGSGSGSGGTGGSSGGSGSSGGGSGGATDGGGSGEGGSGGGGTPPEPDIYDVEELKDRLQRIKRKSFKLPDFAKSFFNVDLNDGNFYYYQCRLAMLNRVAKDVLRYKSPMPVDEAQVFFDFESKFVDHIDFLRMSAYVVSEKYYIRPSSKLLIKQATISPVDALIRWPNLKVKIDTPIEQEVPSLDEIEEILNTNEDPRDPVLMGISGILTFLEKTQADDDSYYRVLSLSAFYKPELFEKNWLKTHLDFMFTYYYQDNLGFSNLINPCFTGIPLNEDALFSGLDRLALGENMNVYNLLRRYDDYIVYVCDNIRCKPSIVAPTKIYRMMLSDCFTEATSLEDRLKKDEIRRNIAFQIIFFYRYSIMLQNNYPNKETSLLNLQKLSNLQKESYSSYVRDVDLQTVRYGI